MRVFYTICEEVEIAMITVTTVKLISFEEQLLNAYLSISHADSFHPIGKTFHWHSILGIFPL